MAKLNSISVRLELEEMAALAAAAHDDDRKVATMAQHAIRDWLQERGWMQRGRAVPKPRKAA